MANLTISQLNKIGERLRNNTESEADIHSLEEFRASFGQAYQEVFDYLSSIGLNPGGRESKTTQSIRAKLVREKTRLSKMQDIAGCRVVVDDLKAQDRAVESLKAKWSNAKVDDRRIKPSHGYRAVHVITEIAGRPVEIQIRTRLQHGWATATEKLADVLSPDIKYGGGQEVIKNILARISGVLVKAETLEMQHAQIMEMVDSVEIGKEELNREFIKDLEQKNELLAKQISEMGGLEEHLKQNEMVIAGVREDLKSMLQDLCKAYTIDFEV